MCKSNLRKNLKRSTFNIPKKESKKAACKKMSLIKKKHPEKRILKRMALILRKERKQEIKTLENK